MAKKQYECRGDPYQTLALSYNKEMDQLMMTNTIINKVDAKDVSRLNDEEEREVLETIYPKDTTMDSEEQHKTTKSTTPKS
jgi:uncharacterized protein YaaW (UPF0174 family)